jgi:hypothetical protein
MRQAIAAANDPPHLGAAHLDADRFCAQAGTNDLLARLLVRRGRSRRSRRRRAASPPPPDRSRPAHYFLLWSSVRRGNTRQPSINQSGKRRPRALTHPGIFGKPFVFGATNRAKRAREKHRRALEVGTRHLDASRYRMSGARTSDHDNTHRKNLSCRRMRVTAALIAAFCEDCLTVRRPLHGNLILQIKRSAHSTAAHRRNQIAAAPLSSRPAAVPLPSCSAGCDRAQPTSAGCARRCHRMIVEAARPSPRRKITP